jgi:hypothetical protein
MGIYDQITVSIDIANIPVRYGTAHVTKIADKVMSIIGEGTERIQISLATRAPNRTSFAHIHHYIKAKC